MKKCHISPPLNPSRDIIFAILHVFDATCDGPSHGDLYTRCNTFEVLGFVCKYMHFGGSNFTRAISHKLSIEPMRGKVTNMTPKGLFHGGLDAKAYMDAHLVVLDGDM